jgi:hypothetical protein
MSNSERLIESVVDFYRRYESPVFKGRYLEINNNSAGYREFSHSNFYYTVRNTKFFHPLFLKCDESLDFNRRFILNDESRTGGMYVNNITPTQLVRSFLGYQSPRKERDSFISVNKNVIFLTNSAYLIDMNKILEKNLLFFITINRVEKEPHFHLWCSFELQGFPKFRKTLEKYIIEPLILNFKNVKLTYLSSQDMFTNIFSTYVEAPLSQITLQKFVAEDLLTKLETFEGGYLRNNYL